MSLEMLLLAMGENDLAFQSLTVRSCRMAVPMLSTCDPASLIRRNACSTS